MVWHAWPLGDCRSGRLVKRVWTSRPKWVAAGSANKMWDEFARHKGSADDWQDGDEILQQKTHELSKHGMDRMMTIHHAALFDTGMSGSSVSGWGGTTEHHTHGWHGQRQESEAGGGASDGTGKENRFQRINVELVQLMCASKHVI